MIRDMLIYPTAMYYQNMLTLPLINFPHVATIPVSCKVAMRLDQSLLLHAVRAMMSKDPGMIG